MPKANAAPKSATAIAPGSPTAPAAKKHATQQSLNSAIKSVCDIMRRSNCAGAMKYVPELTWILFLRILDEREATEAEEAAALGHAFVPTLQEPHRWRDWADPAGTMRSQKDAKIWDFVHTKLLPHLRVLKDVPGASPRQKVVSQIMSRVDRTQIDSERNFLDVLDKVHEISQETVDTTHVFTISQVYEGLLLKMGEKGNDGGQFFTPREVIRTMVKVTAPKLGETVYDPGCGTGGFLAEAYDYMRKEAGDHVTGPQLEMLKTRTFHGREKDDSVYPIALANLVLHGIDEPRLWHGNTLTRVAAYDGLFQGAPECYDVVLMNPPFGGKEGKSAQTHFDFKTSSTQMLFLQDVLRSMGPGSRCGIVLDEGVLFRVDQEAFVKTKQKLLDECEVSCIVSLPGGVFTAAGAGVKTNLVFFKKGPATERIWYYDLSDIKIGKKTPMTQAHFEEFLKHLANHADTDRSWTVDFTARRETAYEEAKPLRIAAAEASAEMAVLDEQLKAARKAKQGAKEITLLETKLREALLREREAISKADGIENAVYDLKAVNPKRSEGEAPKTTEEIMAEIASQGAAVVGALERLRKLM
jgi:type I restriction enzyme M protein